MPMSEVLAGVFTMVLSLYSSLQELRPRCFYQNPQYAPLTLLLDSPTFSCSSTCSVPSLIDGNFPNTIVDELVLVLGQKTAIESSLMHHHCIMLLF